MKLSVAIAGASAALASAASLTPRASKLPQITVKGNAFFAGSERFFIKGVDYQPGGSSDAKDPIADVDGCKRDVAEFKKLGVNTIRVYTVDNTANHDECMSALSDAGIYLALDVNTPKYSLNRNDPAVSYNAVYLQSIFATIDAFAHYDNTLLFFSGNEVINADNNTDCAPFVKAVTRDMKQYIGSRGYRKIPVGYSAADVESNRYDMATYMNCGTDDQRSDFFSFNDYSWCDPSNLQQSGWAAKAKKYADYSIPLFLSEYGCITNKRTWEETGALYGSTMTPVYSGGLAYEYSESGNHYGLVTINGDSVEESTGFQDLANQLKKAQPGGDYNANGKPSTCPSQSATWQVKDFLGEALPAMPQKAEDYMKNGAGTGPGLSGAGSQTSGSESVATAAPGSGSTGSSGSSGKSAAPSIMHDANLLRSVVLVFGVFFGLQLL